MTADLEERAAWAERALRDLADTERRRATAGYFPTALEILGVSAPRMRMVLRQLLRDLKGRPPGDVLRMVGILRDQGTHEARQIAFEMLDRRKDARSLLTAREVRRLGRGNDNWASVDAFGGYVAGPLWREGRVPDEEVLSWASDTDLWWRRTALVATVRL